VYGEELPSKQIASFYRCIAPIFIVGTFSPKHHRSILLPSGERLGFTLRQLHIKTSVQYMFVLVLPENEERVVCDCPCVPIPPGALAANPLIRVHRCCTAVTLITERIGIGPHVLNIYVSLPVVMVIK
jgi:hypothetical protein